MPGKRILSDAQLEKLAELRERGLSEGQIAQWFTARGTPISEGSISWQCLRLGIDVPPERRRLRAPQPRPYVRNGRQVLPFSPEEDRRLLALEAEGLAAFTIARRLGRAPNSIKGRLYTLARHEARKENPNV